MSYVYVGSELDLFAAATTWKGYVRKQIAPYLGREVLEVGAGHGGTTSAMCRGEQDRWVCLEPDGELLNRAAKAIAEGKLPACCEAVQGTLDSLPPEAKYDTLLYMDVMEHIEDDRSEARKASDRLKPGGHLVILSPAHQFLFTPFDTSIGHFRRYSKRTLREIIPADLERVRLSYLDTVGLLASLGNRLVLKSAMPNPRQIAVWDKMMVPFSKIVDPILGYTWGKSVLGVWRKPKA
ncbi:class I SAM-dependent methyltransferase [Tundrisphaera sp. TA3]|uniref:class I SAM-dependent methyltransferase n=1 Tax=Tundrisphaera sp. TA3 TaxID=3435775 RepID=UPI003EBA16AF